MQFNNKDLVIIQNPIDDSKMIWCHNEFTIKNFPGPDFQKEQKRESFRYVLEKGKGVLDIGAHIGDYGLCLAHALKNINRSDITVYCIDPTPEKCQFMEVMKKVNNLENVKVICRGISNQNKNYSVKSYGSSGLNACRINTGGWQWTSDKHGIEFTTLDDLYNENEIGPIGFFWLDAQWSEEKILQGGKKYLSTYKPYILMEYCPCTLYHPDGETVMTVSEGTKEMLRDDLNFQRIFSENNIQISDKVNKFEDILLEFKK